jgi:diguanylate cyclase (GGDEF)-like protein
MPTVSLSNPAPALPLAGRGGPSEQTEAPELGMPEHDGGRLAGGPSLLCADEATRRRMLDMESHLRPARVAVFAALAGTLVVLAPWTGWWPLAPLAGAVVGFRLADRIVPHSRRPEYLFMAAWGFAQLMIGLSVIFTGGPRSLFLPWLAIPAATLSARFNARGVIAGMVWTAAIMVAATVGVNSSLVVHSPQRLLIPLTLLGGVGVLSTALMRSDVKYRAEAAIDPLTGLFNRQALTLRAAELIEQARAADVPMATLIGDLDHFKDVNDRHGHLVGDAVLREVANTLRRTLRSFDYVYRYGGEEFVVLLPGSDEASGRATAERLRIAVAEARPAALEMTMSFGVAVKEGPDATLEELLIAADRALYRAKAEGRDRVCVGHAADALSLDSPQGSLAAHAEALEHDTPTPTEATPASAFAAARSTFLMGQRLEMSVLATQLGVSAATLSSWCGEHETLLGEILASLSEGLLRSAAADQDTASGAPRILAIYRQYVGSLLASQALHVFIQQQPARARQILTSTKGHVHPRTVRALYELLREEERTGAFAPRTDLHSLAYAIVRLSEGFLYDDTMPASEPKLERAAQVVALLLD